MKPSTRLINTLAIAYGAPFVWIGIQHFMRPEVFIPIVPDYLGWPELWVHITGWTEVALGIGIMLPRHRKLAATLMIAQLLLLYLANLNMWLNNIPFEGRHFGHFAHTVRLLIQLLLIGSAAWIRHTATSPQQSSQRP